MATEYTQRLTKKGAVAARVEGLPGVAETINLATDSLEVSEPNYVADPTMIERPMVSGDLAPFASLVGAKKPTMTFTAELKGNGKVQDGASAPVVARCLAACGYTFISTTTPAERVLKAFPAWNNPVLPAVSTATGGNPTLTKPVLYTVEVSVGGPSGTAKALITSNDLGVDNTGDDVDQTITSGGAVQLGSSGATFTPTFTGSLIAGTKWTILVLPVGLKLKPISGSAVPTVTLDMWLDGMRHRMPGARGTFVITAEAGNVAKVAFTFNGAFVAPVDEVTPSPSYPDALVNPPLVEFSNLTWGRNANLVVQQWTFTQANTVSPRDDVNADDGLRNYRITSRAPTGGFNPEATLEAEQPFWGDFISGAQQAFFSKVGTEIGNIAGLFVPRAQVSGMPYGDREGSRIYDVSYGAKRTFGDDEAFLFFC